jgi:hypothetical protein
MKFKLWLENIDKDKKEKIKDFFDQALRALGNSGSKAADTMGKSLKNAVFRDLPKGTRTKDYVQDVLRDVFAKMSEMDEFKSNIKKTTEWLGKDDSSVDKDMKTLFQKMFGDYYYDLVGIEDFSSKKDHITEKEPATTPPSASAPPSPEQQSITPPPEQPGTTPMPEQQPMPQQPGMPTNPQMQMPAGAEQGLF